MQSSDSDSDSDWNRELLLAVSKRQGNGPEITEQARCEQMQNCLTQGADINSVDKNGNTVLHIAAKKGYPQVTKFLLLRGAMTDICNKQNYTAVMLAQSRGKHEIANILCNPVVHLPTATGKLKPIDNEKPSTSRGSTSLTMRWDLSPNLAATQSLKRNPNSASEYDGTAKKRSKRYEDDTVNSGNTNSGRDEGRIVQTAHFDPKETYAASGLKRTLHGIVYQWKHLMLVLNRAWKMGYHFRLSTEMDAAEKFDDLVLEYVDSGGTKVHRFVQAKHKIDNTKTISARDLLDMNDGDFSVLKYFISWRKIRNRSEFDGSDSKTFTLCTNIGIDIAGLNGAKINVSVVAEPDIFLKIANRTVQPPRYNLKVDKDSELHQTLKSASDLHRLARELADRVRGSKDIHLNTDMLKRYHTALSQEVVDIKKQEFSSNFIRNNQLKKAGEFRKVFFFYLKKLSPRNASDNDIWKSLEGSRLKLSTTFGTRFKLETTPELTHVGPFSAKFIELLKNASSGNVVKIDRRVYSKRASDLSIERVVADNIDKLAGHVLVTENGRIKFSSQFLNDTTQLLGNIGQFKDALKTGLKSKFDELGDFGFEITNFKTCTEEELFSRTELPDDDIDDGEISDFLNGFILATNQPDESELGEMIRDEIGHSQLNLPDAKFVTDSFQIEILEWFKETGKQSVFLLNENARDIFNEIEGRLSSLITTDLRLEYPGKLKEWDIRFERENKELQKFVEGTNFISNRILLISSRQSSLTALRIYQTLTNKAEAHDGFIFIHLRRLFETKIIDQVLRAFKWRRNHNLLVVDCESLNYMQHTQKLWNPLCEIMKENDRKKVILITQGNTDSAINFSIGHKLLLEESDDISIKNLKKCSQQKLLERKIVKFQGRMESFGQLLDIHDFDNIGRQKFEALERVIDPIILIQLIEGKEIKVGNKVEGLSTTQDYYIPRTIVRHVVIKEDIFEARGSTDLFAISGVGERDMEKLLANHERLRAFDRTSQMGHLPTMSECLILGDGREVEEFKTLCEQNSERNIHWLRGASRKFIWVESFGDITNLMAFQDITNLMAFQDITNLMGFRNITNLMAFQDGVQCDNDNDSPGVTHLIEDQLVEHDEQRKIVILSDTAGMGKSTVLTSLAVKIKDKEPSLLVIRINLTQHTTVLDEEKENRTFQSNNTNGALDFLVDKLSRLDTHLESQVYKTMIKESGNTALLFDGFDEINPTYGDVVSDLLQALVKLPIKKLFVTTRPYTCKVLEKKLGTFAHRLQPFSPDNQVEFLIKFWRQGLSENDFNEGLEERLKVRAKNVMNLLSKAISHQMVEFTGVPLQTMMVAEVYRYDGVSEREGIADSTESELEFPVLIDMIDLYGKFVDKKYHIYVTEKKPGDHTNVPEMIDSRNTRKIFSITHEKLALDALFYAHTVEALLKSQPEVIGLYKLFCDGNMGEQRTGIINQVIDHKPQFVHRTFAEYFAGEFLIRTLKDDKRNMQVRNFFITELFVHSHYKTIRAFLNCHLSGEAHAVGNQFWILDSRENRNINCETVYHVAAKESNVDIVRFFVNRLGDNSEDNSNEGKPYIDLLDVFGNTPLAIAVNTAYNLEIIELFVAGGANINWKRGNNETLLHIAVQKPNNLAVVKYLCDKGVYIDSRNTDGWTPLHQAISETADLEIVRYLVNGGADINCQNSSGFAPLHYAAAFISNLDIVKYLCEKGAIVDIRSHAGFTPLHEASAGADNLDIVKYLICEKGADVNIEANNGVTPLHVAAGQAGNLHVVQYLCENGAVINFPDKNGWTSLHYAASTNHSEFLEGLYRNTSMGAYAKSFPFAFRNINYRDLPDKTTFHQTFVKGSEIDVVKYLIEKGAAINTPTKDGSTPLHFALENNQWEIQDFLVEKGADTNFKDTNGRTPYSRFMLKNSFQDSDDFNV